MRNRKAEAHWEGGLRDGKGRIRLGSGAFEGAYSFSSRMGDAGGTNPEELVCAALAGCFTMALANACERAGHAPRNLDTSASVELVQDGNRLHLSAISLHTEAVVVGMDEATFQKLANEAQRNCPLSQALDGVQITLEASLSNKPALAEQG